MLVFSALTVTVVFAPAISGCAAPAQHASGESAEAMSAGWEVLSQVSGEEVAPRVFSKPVLASDFDKLVLWGAPAKKSGSDWDVVALDLTSNHWQPLTPLGKESWAGNRPRDPRPVRWGVPVTFESYQGVLLTRPRSYFNQAAYVPGMKKVLFFVGGKTFTFDPGRHVFEQLAIENSPPHVVWGALCYDAHNDEVMLFGGGAGCEENRPGTWLFSIRNQDWYKLDQPLTEQPPARCNAPLAYDSRNKLIAVFGGDAQSHYLADTWVYDCTRRRWQELKTNFKPHPRVAPALCYIEKEGVFLMGGEVPRRSPWEATTWEWGEETWTLDAARGKWTRVAGKFPAGFWTSAVYDAKRKRAVLYQAAGRWPKETMVWTYEGDLTPVGKGAPAPRKPVLKRESRMPGWYTEELPPVDRKKAKQFLESLEANVWTFVDVAKPAPMRTWGSATIDTDRHQVIYWGGGHVGYCGTDVSHFSLVTLRWSSSFLPEFPPAPYSGEESSFDLPCRAFSGRPWVQHGRVSYVYDPLSQKVVFTESPSTVPKRYWTYIYDPVEREFTSRFRQPFIGGWAVSGLAVSTPYGVYKYLTRNDHRSPQVGLFKLDLEGRKWSVEDAGKASVPAPERDRIVYDSKRDRLVLTSYKKGNRDLPAMYAWDFRGKTGDWVELAMSGELPKAFYREGVYIAEHDRILNLTRGEGLYVCDLAEGNKWSRTEIELPIEVNPNTAMVYDPGLDVLVLLHGSNRGPVKLWLMRYVP